ncbi:MAG: putative tellurium resistance membrane protein TerC [Porticoccaceae bacterium]
MDVFFSFISLVLLSAGLGIDNGLLIEFSLKGLNLDEKKHMLWRSVALVMAALLRIVFLFSLSQLSFLENPQPASNWFPNLWFAPEGAELTWMSLVLFGGGLIILAMAVWEYYHKFREELEGHSHAEKDSKSGTFKVLAVVGYLALMNVLFSLDSVFAAVAIMDLETQFWWMVAAILVASGIMVFCMIPLSAIVAKNKHFGVLMLSILAVIATKLLVDGTGSHFSNGLLIFIICVLLLNDAAQAMIDKAAAKRIARTAAKETPA